MQTQSIIIPNKLGLHARASMKLIKTIERFHSEVFIKCHNREIDAKDIMQLMALAVTKGTEIEIITKGQDETETMQAIIQLINNKFGESE